MTPLPTVSREYYDARERRWAGSARAARRQEDLLGWTRAVVFLAAVTLAALAFDGTLSVWWSGLAILAFVTLGYRHGRVRRTREEAERRREYAQRALTRLDGGWRGAGATGERWVPEDHPYARDLDIVGQGSLFQLINTATTTMGEESLVDHLLAPGTAAAVAERQAAVRELAEDYDLREDLAAAGGVATLGLQQERLARWAATGGSASVSGWRAGALGVTAANAAALLGYAIDTLPALVMVVTMGGMGLVALTLRGRVLRSARSVDQTVRDLDTLGRLLDVLGSRRFQSPLLHRLRSALEAGPIDPARAIRRLARWADLAASTKNQLTAPLRLVTLWLTHVGLGIEAWRRRHGPAVATWLSVVGEIEGLCSLASHRFDHPDDVVPEVRAADGPCFLARGIVHPLLPRAVAVPNDVELGDPTRVLIVSGSNMSGKSTLLRAVGVNAVLAMAGGTVRATHLTMAPLRLGASIVVSDSLADGRSRFYAEILRLKAIMKLAEEGLTLFLVDEILQGTNSHDRRIGTEAIVRGFLARGAVGAMTTHDLALTEIADAIAPAARNVHFADEVADGRLTFDYRLRPGVVRRSNALRLMREVGLPLPESEA